jgi:hypothetical protein
MFSQNLSIIGFSIKKLHLPEIERVELSVFFSNLVKIVFCFKA